MTLALVFAMSGGAYAAKTYLITSTKQISPKVLKQLKGANGEKGTNGTNGVSGKDGAQGAPGPEGKTGLEGKTGPEGKAGGEGKPGTSITNKAIAASPTNANCKEGGSEFTGAENKKTYACDGSPWTAGGTLPKGSTETGAWSIQSTATGEEVKATTISFSIPLASSPAPVFVAFGEPVPTECAGGTVEKPEAASGVLCIFEGEAPFVHRGELAHLATEGPGGSALSTAGAELVFASASSAKGSVTAEGTWAVTG